MGRRRLLVFVRDWVRRRMRSHHGHIPVDKLRTHLAEAEFTLELTGLDLLALWVLIAKASGEQTNMARMAVAKGVIKSEDVSQFIGKAMKHIPRLNEVVNAGI